MRRGAWGRPGSAALFNYLCADIRARIFCVFSTDRHDKPTASYVRDEADPKSTPNPAARGGLPGPACSAPPLAQLVWAAAEAAATSTWVLRPLGGSRREKRTYQACAPTPHYDSAEQQQRSFWGTVDMVASRPQGSPLRRDAQAGDRAVAVHRRPRDETTQMPAAHPR